MEFIPALPEEELKFIEFILGTDFPFYYESTTSNYKGLCHSLVARNKENILDAGIVWSKYGRDSVNLISNICGRANIKVNKIYRAAVNLTTYSDKLMGDLHKDHTFPHKIFLMYLNSFTNGSTFELDKNSDKLIEHTAEKHKVLIMDGENLHAQGFCGVDERRVVLVASFN